MQGTLVHRLTIFNFLKLFVAFWLFSARLNEEEHLLSKSPIKLMHQFFLGLSVIKVVGWQIVGHVTLWHLHDHWYELGTLWVDPGVRKHGVGFEIMESILEQRKDLSILMTTTNQVVKNMGTKLGMNCLSFWDLESEIHSETCICDKTKTGTGNYQTCQKKDGACSLFVRQS